MLCFAFVVPLFFLGIFTFLVLPQREQRSPAGTDAVAAIVVAVNEPVEDSLSSLPLLNPQLVVGFFMSFCTLATLNRTALRTNYAPTRSHVMIPGVKQPYPTKLSIQKIPFRSKLNERKNHLNVPVVDYLEQASQLEEEQQ